jgi:hypothetical protein
MHLYEINPKGAQSVFIVAHSPHEAADLYATWSAANDRVHHSFTVDDLPLDSLVAEQQAQVRRALAAGLAGIVHFDEAVGWTFSPPMWQPLGDHELPAPHEEGSPAIRIWEMRDLTPIEAVVLARDYDRATELFERHLRAHGGNPDALLYREVGLEHLDEPANDAVNEALDIGWEGLVSCDANGRWSFVAPLGCHRD